MSFRDSKDLTNGEVMDFIRNNFTADVLKDPEYLEKAIFEIGDSHPTCSEDWWALQEETAVLSQYELDLWDVEGKASVGFNFNHRDGTWY